MIMWSMLILLCFLSSAAFMILRLFDSKLFARSWMASSIFRILWRLASISLAFRMAFLVVLAKVFLSLGSQFSSEFASVGCVVPSLSMWSRDIRWSCSFIILARIFSALYFSHSLREYAICSLGTFLRPKCLLAALVMILRIVFHCLFRL